MFWSFVLSESIIFQRYIVQQIVMFRSPVLSTVCTRSSYPFRIVSYYIRWVTTSWTQSIFSILHLLPVYRIWVFWSPVLSEISIFPNFEQCIRSRIEFSLPISLALDMIRIQLEDFLRSVKFTVSGFPSPQSRKSLLGSEIRLVFALNTLIVSTNFQPKQPKYTLKILSRH